MIPKLSILIPSIPSRFGKMQNLYNKLLIECENLPIEILCLLDNKKRSIGKKRQALVDIAKGDYVAILDDDDDFFEGYGRLLVDASSSGADVITFKQKATVDGKSFIVDFDLFHSHNEEARINDNGEYANINRLPFHVCAWKREIAQSERFEDVGYSEDWDWCERLIKKANTQYKIDAVLHHYIYDSKVTEAPTESNEVWINPNK